MTTMRTTISFRIPQEAEDAFRDLAKKESKPGRRVKVSDLYNEALAQYAKCKGIEIEEWSC